MFGLNAIKKIWFSLKGHCHGDFVALQVNFLLKLLFSTFTRTQNVPAELRRRYQMKFSKFRLNKVKKISHFLFSSFNPFPFETTHDS